MNAPRAASASPSRVKAMPVIPALLSAMRSSPTGESTQQTVSPPLRYEAYSRGVTPVWRRKKAENAALPIPTAEAASVAVRPASSSALAR